MSICNSNKPSLDQINENIFKAIDRANDFMEFKSSKNTLKNNRDTNSMAVGVVSPQNANSNKSLFCSLCSTQTDRVTNHATKDCTEYLSIESKIKRLKSINGCTLCGYSNHATNKCKFKFQKNCFSCNGPHMTYLCQKNISKNKSESEKPKNSKFSSLNKSVSFGVFSFPF